MGRRLSQIGIAIDQLINACCGGWADETLSCRAWRQREKKNRWSIMRRVIDALFFMQKDHCKTAYESEIKRRHLPPELREKI